MTVALYEPPEETNARRRWVELMKPAAELAEAIARTDFVPAGLRGNPAAIAACVLYGDEVGLGPLQSLAKIAVIDGRPALSSEAMRSLILAAGHELWIEEATTTKATVAGRRSGSEQVSSVTWTMDDARRANLAGRRNWRTYPRQMLVARATAELARVVFADAIGGLAVTEELEEADAAVAEETSADEPTTKSRRRRREPATVSPAVATPSPGTDPQPEADSRSPETSLPPLPGEQGYEEETPDEGEAGISEAQRRKLHAALRGRGVDRPERLRWASMALLRPIESFSELTMREASRLIDALEGDDIPFGVPTEPEDVRATVSEPEPPPTPEPPEPSAPPEEPAESAGTGTEGLSSVMFRAWMQSEGFGPAEVAAVGHDLFPDRSLGDLSDAERSDLVDALRATRPEEPEEQP